MNDTQTRSHAAFMLDPRTKERLEVGTGQLDDRSGVFEAYLNRAPIEGFNGRVYFVPIGQLLQDSKPQQKRLDDTHTASVLEPYTKIWLEIGTGRLDGNNGVFEAYLNRRPISGFNGRVYFAPIGTRPPNLEDQPQRPDQERSDDAD